MVLRIQDHICNQARVNVVLERVQATSTATAELDKDLKTKLSRAHCDDYKEFADGNKSAVFISRDGSKFTLSLKKGASTWAVIYEGAKVSEAVINKRRGRFLVSQDGLTTNYYLSVREPTIAALLPKMASFKKNLHQPSKKKE